MSAGLTPEQLADPGWFPLDYDASLDALRFLPLTLDRIGAASFLDRRSGVDWDASEPIVIDALRALAPSHPTLLIHTAFCGSTLLARALHDPPQVVALKEPSALAAIAQISTHEREDAQPFFDRRLGAALDLLGRPWAADGKVLIKPTSPVNRLLARMLAHTAPARAILLYSSFEEFLLSCVKRLPEAETRIRWMAETLLAGSPLPQRIGMPAGHTLNLIESCALAWHAQIDRYAEALAADRSDRLRSLDVKAMLARPQECVAASANWYGFTPEAGALAERVKREFARDAKSPERQYDATRRRDEQRELATRCAPLIEAALRWTGDVVAPATRFPQHWKPLLPM
jgi:hypothetical protein